MQVFHSLFIFFLEHAIRCACARCARSFWIFVAYIYTGYDTICIGCAFPIFVIGRGHIFRMHSASAPYASRLTNIHTSLHIHHPCHPRLLISCWCSFLSLITLLAIRWLVSRIYEQASVRARSSKRNIHTTYLIRYRVVFLSFSCCVLAIANGPQTDWARCCMNCVPHYLNSLLVSSIATREIYTMHLHIIARENAY